MSSWRLFGVDRRRWGLAFVAPLVVAAAFGILSVAGAGAKTLTVGQVFAPNSTCSSGDAGTWLQTSVASGTSYIVPTAGVITSWSWQENGVQTSGLQLKVGRSAGSGMYKIVGQAAAGSQTTSAVNTYSAHVPVKSGDLIGVYFGGGSCGNVTGNALDTVVATPSDVPTGTTASFSTFPLNERLPVSVQVSEDCVVPNLQGQTLTAAKKALRAASCRLGEVLPEGQTTGKVTRQKPAAGKTLAPEAKVNVTLS